MSGQGFYGFPNILGLLRATNIKVLGKAGATAGAGLAGGTTSGAPTSGSFDAGEAVFGQDGSLWICSVAGSPGTFVQAGFANPLTTKADLIVGGTAGTPSRLGVGSDNQVLTADSTQSLGVKWAVTSANAGGALTQIAQTILGSAAGNITFSAIPGTYSALLLVLTARGDTAANNVRLNLQINGDTAANYDWEKGESGGTLASASGARASTQAEIATLSAANAPSGAVGTLSLQIPAYAGTTFRKAGSTQGSYTFDDTSSTSFLNDTYSFGWRSTAAITSLKLFPTSGNLVAATAATLYGLS